MFCLAVGNSHIPIPLLYLQTPHSCLRSAVKSQSFCCLTTYQYPKSSASRPTMSRPHSSKLFQAAVPSHWQQRGESREPFPPGHRAALPRLHPAMLKGRGLSSSSQRMQLLKAAKPHQNSSALLLTQDNSTRFSNLNIVKDKGTLFNTTQ